MRISDWSSDVCSSDLDCRDDFFIGQRTAPVLPSARQATTATQRFKALVHVQRRIGRHVAVAAKFGQEVGKLFGEHDRPIDPSSWFGIFLGEAARTSGV